MFVYIDRETAEALVEVISNVGGTSDARWALERFRERLNDLGIPFQDNHPPLTMPEFPCKATGILWMD